MTMLSETTLALLHRAGWYEDRKVDTSEYEKVLESEGYPVHSVVVNFLSCFGGLRVLHPHHRVPQDNDEFYLDPIEAVENIFPEKVTKKYSLRVNTPLCIIGEAFRGHMVLMMDQEGRVYAGYDDFMVSVGDSGTDAIEALCTRRDLREVP